MSWYKVTMTPQDLAARKDVNLQEQFRQIFKQSNQPPDAVMCSTSDTEFLFSPGAFKIARPLIDRLGGKECDPPKLSQVRLRVCGTGGAEAIPFDLEEGWTPPPKTSPLDPA